MKRIGWLWRNVMSVDNVYEAMHEYNRNRPLHLKRLTDKGHALLISVRMTNDLVALIGEPRTKTIMESGKPRELEIPSYDSCIAQIALWLVCGKYIEKRIHDQSFSSRRGMGGHLAARKCARFVRTKIKHEAKYHLYFDIKKYYAHIDKKRMVMLLERIFKDYKVMDMLTIIIYSTPKGLPIGYPFSHAMANLYLVELYEGIFHIELGKRYRVTKIFVYMDNWLIFAEYKSTLHTVRNFADAWLKSVGCEMKDDWQLSNTESRGVRICGFIIYPKKTRLYRRIWRRIMRNIDKFRERPTDSLWMSLMSRFGWIKAINKDYRTFFNSKGQ